MRKFINRFKKLNNRKGFTLLECIAAIVIIGIMSSSMLALFNQGITYVNKARELDDSSSAAQKMVLANETPGANEYFYEKVPVKIKFTLYLNNDVKELEEIDYQFQAAVSEKKIGNKLTVKVVYFDMMQSQLENLEYN